MNAATAIDNKQTQNALNVVSLGADTAPDVRIRTKEKGLLGADTAPDGAIRTKAGTWLPLKIRTIVGRVGQNHRNGRGGRGDRSLSAIGRKHKVRRQHLSEAASGRRNTPRLIEILETEWSLPIAEIREIIAEDRERRAAGNPVTRDEAREWERDYRARLVAAKTGEDIATVRARQDEIWGGLGQ